MDAKQLTAQLIEDLNKASEVSKFALSMGSIMQSAKAVPKDMAVFVAETWITTGLISLKASLNQLVQVLQSNPDLAEINDPNDIPKLAASVKKLEGVVEATLENMLKPTLVALPTGSPFSTMLTKILFDIHSDVHSLHGTYQNIKDKR